MVHQLPRFALFLATGLLLLIWLMLGLNLPIAEDAAILFRYSENLADTGRISYNPGGERAEGATDFLWMVLIAGLYKLGLSSSHAALGISVFSLIATLWVQYRLVDGKLPQTALLWLGWLLASQQWAAIQGFSVNFWGLSLWLCVWFWHNRSWRFLYLSALACVLIRPDGFFIAAPLAVASLWLFPSERITNLKRIAAWAVIPGLLYYVWRTWYFGEWLPLPFLVKTVATPEKSGLLVVGSVKYLLVYLIRYVGPLWLILVLGKKVREEWREVLVFGTAFVLLPGLLYSITALEQNVANRFVLPLLVGAMALAAIHWRTGNLQRLMWLVFIGLSGFYFFVYGLRAMQTRTQQIADLATELSDIQAHRMAITEAGHLPYQSGWEAIDLWGLNTPALATTVPHERLLDEFAPHLIAWHEGMTPADSLYLRLREPYATTRNWDHMVFNSFKYAYEHGTYEIWRVPFAVPPKPPLDLRDQITLKSLDVLDYFLQLRGSQLAPYERYDWYLLDVEAPAYLEIRKVLLNHGAYKEPKAGFQ